MKLIVGLGNPGRRYQETRHNVGYGLIAQLARRLEATQPGSIRPKLKFEGELIETQWKSERTGDLEKLAILAPHTYMNLSGRSVRAAVSFYQLELCDILIACDDFNLPLGRIRLKPGGSAGGQKGLADILAKLASNEVPRLRMGIGPLPPRWDVSDFVLSKFNRDERPVAEEMIERAADAAACWLQHDMPTAMNRFNGESTT